MNVLLAEEMGMCFGVRDALKILDGIEKPREVTIHGQLVHNEVVLSQLSNRGFHMVEETQRQKLPQSEAVLITAHGISNRERERLENAGKKLIDTTCPLVRRVHEAAVRMQRDGYHVLLIGRIGHVEVRGIVEDLQCFDVIEAAAEAKTYSAQKLAILCQTTVAPRTVTAVRAAIIAANPHAEIRFVDTTCHPTKNRQTSVEKLIPLVETMVVVGGHNSNNTRELVELCRQRGLKTHLVRDANDLRSEWFRGISRVGLTAGTSTLDQTITEVHDWLRDFRDPTPEQEHSHWWNAYFQKNFKQQLTIPWGDEAKLPDDRRSALIPSLQDFQLGESSEGKYGLYLAGRYAARVGDPGYLDAVRLFFAEEGRHASLLKHYLERIGAATIKRSWTDFFFRRIRHLMGLETLITVLLTAELIGKIYYRAIRGATTCPVLRGICSQLLRDEQMHLRFHIERFQIMRANQSLVRHRLASAMHRMLFFGACLAVWRKHGKAMRLGGYGLKRFWREAWHELRTALRIIHKT